MWRSARLWMLIASLASRASGFMTAFALSRLVGLEALGTYSAVVSGASLLVTPFAAVFGNNATVMAAEATEAAEVEPGGRSAYLEVARVNLLAGLLLAGLMFALCVLYFEQLVGRPDPLMRGWLLLGAACVVFGQLLGAILQGLYNGCGQFVRLARGLLLVSVLTLLCLAPALLCFGLKGGLALLLLSSVGPVALLAPSLLRPIVAAKHVGVVREWRMRSLAGLPSLGATTCNAAVAWYCSLYLVREAHGMAGVGVVAIAGQWLVLTLIPATSWGGVTLKSLKDALGCRDDSGRIGAVIGGLIRKNVLATAGLGGVLAIGAPLIARAYGLKNSDLALLIGMNGVVAILASVNNVFERLLLCLNRQGRWLGLSLFSLAVQVLVTRLGLPWGLIAVPLGGIAGALALALACGAWTPRLLAQLALE